MIRKTNGDDCPRIGVAYEDDVLSRFNCAAFTAMGTKMKPGAMGAVLEQQQRRFQDVIANDLIIVRVSPAGRLRALSLSFVRKSDCSLNRPQQFVL